MQATFSYGGRVGARASPSEVPLVGSILVIAICGLSIALLISFALSFAVSIAAETSVLVFVVVAVQEGVAAGHPLEGGAFGATAAMALVLEGNAFGLAG